MKISVCIPTVNRIGLLREAVASVAHQSFRDFEIVLSDNSANIAYNRQVQLLVDEFPELSWRVFVQPYRLSMVENTSYLIQAAQGDYLLFLPDDDRLRPDCLERFASVLDAHPTATFAFSDHWIILPDGRVDQTATDRNTRRYHRAELSSGLLPQNSLFRLALLQTFELQSMMFRRPLIQSIGIAQCSRTLTDYEFQLRLALRPDVAGAYYLTERLTEYRRHAGQITAETDREATLREMIRILANCGPVPLAHLPLYQETLANKYASLSILQAEQGKRALARESLYQCLALQPELLKYRLYRLLIELPRSTISFARTARRLLRSAFA